ncbi:OmpA/MotB [Shewanella denitrificans OS217]|uniref:OmpA/MotB n=1 Tax=Shewanella denitrificans (strain OS217 / ATCC BAA-1090 / DSM 15013) TaxID=318161 RepID=Q12PI2_SHEDO|nr:OmpA family protein [Shewanella denitrificans]ABE54644.1 OmpA/MotB [Shewanella denitrificans OS217]
MLRLALGLWLVFFSFSALAWVDTDADGVPDKKDACANSPKGVIVEANGCHQVELSVQQEPEIEPSDFDSMEQVQTAAITQNCVLDETSEFNLSACDSIDIAPVYFEFAKSQVLQTQKPLLKKIAMLANQSGAKITLVGHTDIIGSEAFNQNLSLKRAMNVSAVLVAEYGLMASDIHYYGVGSTEPADDNATANGRQANRRVEITITLED